MCDVVNTFARMPHPTGAKYIHTYSEYSSLVCQTANRNGVKLHLCRQTLKAALEASQKIEVWKFRTSKMGSENAQQTDKYDIVSGGESIDSLVPSQSTVDCVGVASCCRITTRNTNAIMTCIGLSAVW
jgi:hypothetical protein